MEEKINKLIELITVLNNKSNKMIEQCNSLLGNSLEESLDADTIEYHNLKDFLFQIKDFTPRLTTLDAEINGYLGIPGDKGLKQLLKDCLEKE